MARYDDDDDDGYSREDFLADKADHDYSVMKDEGTRHLRWPHFYDENDRPIHGREVLAPSDRAQHPAKRDVAGQG